MSQELKKVIVQTAIYYGRDIDAGVLSMMAEDLSDLDPNACIQAYSQWRRNPANKSFPLPAQIRELVNPEQFVSVETKAREIAGRIIGAITKYGWANAKEAQVFIGPDGWDLVKRSGGWQHLCESTSPKQTTFLQAQFRDQLMGTLKHGQDAIEQSLGALPQNRVSELDGNTDYLQLVPGLKKANSEPGKDPEGAA